MLWKNAFKHLVESKTHEKNYLVVNCWKSIVVESLFQKTNWQFAQYQLPLGAVVRLRHAIWNHIVVQFGLSHWIISPNEVRRHTHQILLMHHEHIMFQYLTSNGVCGLCWIKNKIITVWWANILHLLLIFGRWSGVGWMINHLYFRLPIRNDKKEQYD